MGYLVNKDDRTEIIIRLVESLNKGGQGFNENRPLWAITQYNELVAHKVIVEEKGLDKLK